MQNLFDTDNYPDSEPSGQVAGTVWGWKRPDITEAYPTASYTLKYLFGLQVTPFTAITITAGKVAGAHVVQATSTGAYAAGQYKWQAVIVRVSDDAEVVVDTGYMQVTAKAATATDTSSWVYQTLVAVREVLKNGASKASSYTINGRTLQRYSLTELLDLEREFSRRWKDEQRAAGAAGKRRTLVGMRA